MPPRRSFDRNSVGYRDRELLESATPEPDARIGRSQHVPPRVGVTPVRGRTGPARRARSSEIAACTGWQVEGLAQPPREDRPAMAWMTTELVALAGPAYFFLQLLMVLRYRGRWRMAALAPLLVMVP